MHQASARGTLVAMSLRLVLDTNVWLDWLLFDDPVVAPVRAAVEAGRAEVFMDAAGEEELARVLAYPLRKRTLDPQALAACLAQCRRWARRLGEEAGGTPVDRDRLPVCDPDDQKFLELALASGAAFLVTKDRTLLKLAPRRDQPLPFRIVTPAQLERSRAAA